MINGLLLKIFPARQSTIKPAAIGLPELLIGRRRPCRQCLLIEYSSGRISHDFIFICHDERHARHGHYHEASNRIFINAMPTSKFHASVLMARDDGHNQTPVSM